MKRNDACHLFIEVLDAGSKNAVNASALLTDPDGNAVARAAGSFHNDPAAPMSPALAMFKAGCMMAAAAGVGQVMLHTDETDGHDMFGVEAKAGPGGSADYFGNDVSVRLPAGGPDPSGDNYWWEGAIDKAMSIAAAVHAPYSLRDSASRKDAAVMASDYDHGNDLVHAAVLLADENGGKKAYLAMSRPAGYGSSGRILASRMAADAAVLLSEAYGSESLVLEAIVSAMAEPRRRAKAESKDGRAVTARSPERDWEDAVQEALLDAVDAISDGCANSGL